MPSVPTSDSHSRAGTPGAWLIQPSSPPSSPPDDGPPGSGGRDLENTMPAKKPTRLGSHGLPPANTHCLRESTGAPSDPDVVLATLPVSDRARHCAPRVPCVPATVRA